MRQLSVGQSLMLLGGVGLLGTLVNVAGSFTAAQDAVDAQHRITTNAQARSLARALDTRASELKVDGYKALLLDSPADELPELKDDAAKVTTLLDALDGLPLTTQERDAITNLRPAFVDYTAGMEDVINGAVADQQRARTRFEDIQAANDVTDEAVGGALDALDAIAVRTTDELDSGARRLRLLGLVVGLLSAALVVAVALAVRRSVLGRLSRVADVLATAAGGDLTARVDVRGRDELARMGEAANGALGSLGTAMAGVVATSQRLAGEADSLKDVAQRAFASASAAAEQAQDASTAADSVSESVQHVALGSSEMGTSISEIANNAQEAVAVAEGAVSSVDSTTARMSELAESSSEIGDVVRLITSIAEQTNLLALNATIEAARAGDAGKGFAVVADEVKQLAQETARATEDISRRVDAIQVNTGQAGEAIAEIAGVMTRITEFQASIAGAVEEQTATTSAMNEGVAQAAGGSESVARTVREVAAAASGAAQVVEAARSSADLLGHLSAELDSTASRYRF